MKNALEILHKKTPTKKSSITEIEINASSVMPLQSFLNKPSNRKGVGYPRYHNKGYVGHCRRIKWPNECSTIQY